MTIKNYQKINQHLNSMKADTMHTNNQKKGEIKERETKLYEDRHKTIVHSYMS